MPTRRKEILPLEADPPGDDAARRLAHEPHDRKRRDALAAPRLADQAEMLTLAELEVDAVDGLRHPWRVKK